MDGGGGRLRGWRLRAQQSETETVPVRLCLDRGPWAGLHLSRARSGLDDGRFVQRRSGSAFFARSADPVESVLDANGMEFEGLHN